MSFLAERLAETRLILDAIGPEAEELETTQRNMRTHIARIELILEKNKNKGENPTVLKKHLADSLSRYQKTYADFFERKRIKLEGKEYGLEVNINGLKDLERTEQEGDKESIEKLTKERKEVGTKKKAWQEVEDKTTAILKLWEN